MLKKIILILLFIIILLALGWNIFQWQGINKKISSLETKIDKIVKETGVTEGTGEMGKTGYEVTIDMWQIFEKELQDYKQRLREGKQQYTEQVSGWNSLLAELKKSLQEYDKFIAAEGDFWEKQLKNYDKLLAKTEERFEILGQAIEELQNIATNLKDLLVGKEGEIKGKELEKVPVEEEEEPARRGQKITPQIKGGGEYKTYPPKEEEKSETGETSEEEKGEVIRGTVTGSGEYKTY